MDDKTFVPYPFEARRHRAVLPVAAGGHESGVHPVVVAGGGPVGLCTALGLARWGVPVLLLEADDSVCFGSRAICISRRSLEIAERLGALPGFLAEGLPWTGGRSFYRQQQVLAFQMPADDNQKLPPMVNLAQYSIEQILLNRAEALAPLIQIRWGSRLAALQPGDAGLRLAVDTPDGGYTLDAHWLVAADGGRSTVREALGLRLQGATYEGRYVIVDIRMASARPTERLAYFDPPCNPGSTVLVHKQPHDVWRIDYQLRDGEDPDAAVRPENVLPRVQSLLDMMGETAPWQPIWVGLYKANALTLPSYRAGPQGRVLLAGDAAHLVPIFGVRGANSGIDDADNLAWKLAAVVQGRAAPKLLDSYSHERVAAAHENLSHGTKSTEFMAPPSFAFELMRTAVLGLAARHPGLASLVNPRQTAPVSYPDSPLNQPDAEPWPAGPAPGQVLPEVPVAWPDDPAGPGHLTDAVARARGFVALCFVADGALPDALARELLDAGVTPIPITPAMDSTGRAWPMYGAVPGTPVAALVLVRPDGHVLARWRGGPPPGAVAAAVARAWAGGDTR